MPAFTNKDQKRLDALGLSHEAKEAARRVWGAKPDDSKKSIIGVPLSLATIGILVGSLFVPALAPLVNVATVLVWLVILLYVFAGIAITAISVAMKGRKGDKVEGFLLSRSILELSVGRGSKLKKVWGWSVNIGLAVSLALAGSTLTAFFFVISFGVLKFGYHVLAKNTREYLDSFVGEVERGDFGSHPGTVEGQFVRIS